MGSERRPAATKKTTVIEAQDAIAACFGEIESLAWRFFAIARDLQAPEESDDFPSERPGPKHLRWFTALGASAVHTDLLETLESARQTAMQTEADLLAEWERKQVSTESRRKGQTS